MRGLYKPETLCCFWIFFLFLSREAEASCFDCCAFVDSAAMGFEFRHRLFKNQRNSYRHLNRTGILV